MREYLVTGGAGFIGSNIVRELLSRGEQVRVLDDFSTGRRSNLSEVVDNITLIEGDIRDYETVQAVVEGVDFVLHQAALPSVPRSIEDPFTSAEINVLGTVNILRAASEAGIKKVVYASSSSVYGDSPTLPKKEEMQTNPRSPYAVSKLAGEDYCRVFHSVYDLPVIALRYFNVFGPRQDPNSQYAAVIPKFIRAVQQDKSPTVYGDGEQSRDFTYISNVVEANLRAALSTQVTDGVYNLACGKGYSLNQLLSHIAEMLGKRVEPVYTDERSGDVRHSLADISSVQNDLDYSPSVSFEVGLQKTIDSMLDDPS